MTYAELKEKLVSGAFEEELLPKLIGALVVDLLHPEKQRELALGVLEMNVVNWDSRAPWPPAEISEEVVPAFEQKTSRAKKLTEILKAVWNKPLFGG